MVRNSQEICHCSQVTNSSYFSSAGKSIYKYRNGGIFIQIILSIYYMYHALHQWFLTFFSTPLSLIYAFAFASAITLRYHILTLLFCYYIYLHCLVILHVKFFLVRLLFKLYFNITNCVFQKNLKYYLTRIFANDIIIELYGDIS